MSQTLVIHGRYVGGTFIPDSPLPDTFGLADLVITPTTAGSAGSISAAFGKASTLRSGEEILSQHQADRDEWGGR